MKLDSFDWPRTERLARMVILATIAWLTVTAPVATASPRSAAPTVSVRPAFVMARPTTSELSFVLALSSPSQSPVKVRYRTVNGTGVAGTNFVAASGTVTIPARARETMVVVAVKPVAISARGSTKRMSLRLSQASGATLGTSAAIGTIYPDPYVAPHSGSFGAAVINPNSRFAYITDSSTNEVEVLNLNTGRYGASIPVGSDPTSLDITPDGRTLYVCDSGGQTISVVNVARAKVVHTIVTPAGFDSERPFSIAIDNDGTALFTTTFNGSGYGAHVYQLDLSSDAITVFTQATANGLVNQDTPLTRSSDYSTIAGVVGEDSGGKFFVVHPKSGTVVTGALSDYLQWPALNSDGSTLLIDPASDGWGAGTYVVDPTSGTLMGTITGRGAGLAMGSSSTGYRIVTGGVEKLDVPQYLQGGSLPAPDAQTPRGLSLSRNGHVLLAPTSSGVTIIRQ